MNGRIIAVLMSIFVIVIMLGSMLVPTIDNISTDDGWDETIDTVFNDDPAEILLSRQSSNFALSLSVVNDGSDLTITNDADTITAAIAPQFIIATDSSSIFINEENEVICIWTDNTGTHDIILNGDFTAAIANDKLTITENGIDTDLPLPEEYLYYPSSTGEYGSFTTGDLSKRSDDPLIAAGSFADVTAYNLNNTRGTDIVQSAIVSPTSITSVEWVGESTVTDPLLQLNPLDPQIIQPLNPGNPGIVMAAPPTPTYTDGDWGYNLADSNATIVSYSGSSGNITIPATVGGYDVVGVGIGQNNNPVFDTDLITNSTVTISSGITRINAYAFRGCTGLTSVTIPSTITYMGADAFRGCTGLTSVSLSEGLTTLGASTFYGCTGLTSVTIPSTITYMGSYAFRGCTGLTSVSLSEGLTTTGASTFYGCTGLTSVSLPEGLTSIDSSTFYGCTGLTSVSLPEGLTSIGGSAFYGCTGLTSVSLPEGLTSIGASAFYGCTGLTSITIPYGVTIINGQAFRNCTGLTSFVIPSTVTNLGLNSLYGTNIDQVLNLSDVNVTSTSHGLNNADVRTNIDAAAYIAPAILHKTYHHMGLGEFMGEILPILPLIIIGAVVIAVALFIAARRD